MKKRFFILMLLGLITLPTFSQVPTIKRTNYYHAINVDSTKMTINRGDRYEEVYKTTEIINWNYLDKIKKTLLEEVAVIRMDLYKNSLSEGYDKGVYTTADINNELLEIKQLKEELKNILSKQNIQIQSLRKYKNKDIYEYFHLERRIDTLKKYISISETKMDKHFNDVNIEYDSKLIEKFSYKIDSCKEAITNLEEIQLLKLKELNNNQYSETIIYLDLELKKDKIQRRISLMKKNLSAGKNIDFVNFSEKKQKSRHLIIKQKRDSIQKLQHQMDSLYHLYVMDLLNSRTWNIGFNKNRTKAYYDLMYSNGKSKIKTLSNSGFTFGDNSSSVYTELISGELSVFRIGLGTMVSKSSASDSLKSKQEEAFQRLATLGGNTVLNVEYPLIFAHDKNHFTTGLLRLMGKGTADFPEFGTTTDKWAGSAVLGLDFYGEASTSNRDLKFFIHFKYSKVYGTNVFKDNLGTKSNNFFYGQLNLGITILDNIKLSFNVWNPSNESILDGKSILIGGQVMHN